jgi:hypothetical protein
MAYSRLRDLRSVRHPYLLAYPWIKIERERGLFGYVG